MVFGIVANPFLGPIFQYSLCRVVLMVVTTVALPSLVVALSVLALSSRFDGLPPRAAARATLGLSVLALSSRFDGRTGKNAIEDAILAFSTRSVESF